MPQTNAKFQGTGTSSFSLTAKDDAKSGGAATKKAAPVKAIPAKASPKTVKKEEPSPAAKATSGDKKPVNSPKTGPSKASKSPAVSLKGNSNEKRYVKMNPKRMEDKPGKIIVLGLPMETTFTEKDFEELFIPYGRITETYIIVDKRKNNLPRGYGFITFENPDDALDAKKALEGKDIGGKEPIHIEQAFIDATLPRPDHANFNKGFRGRGGPRGRGEGFRGRGGPGRGRGPGRGMRRGGGYQRGGRGGPSMKDGRFIQPLMSVGPGYDDFDSNRGYDYEQEYVDTYEDDFGMEDSRYEEDYDRDVPLTYTIDNTGYRGGGGDYDDDLAYERRGGGGSLRHSPERQSRRPLSSGLSRPQGQSRQEISYSSRAELDFEEEYEYPREERRNGSNRREPIAQSRGLPPSRGERVQDPYGQRKTLLPDPAEKYEEDFYDDEPQYQPVQRSRGVPTKRIEIIKYDDGYVEERVIEEYESSRAPARPVPASGRGVSSTRGRGGPPVRGQQVVVMKPYQEPVYVDGVQTVRRQGGPLIRETVPGASVVRSVPQRTGVLGDSPYVEYEDDGYEEKRMPPSRRRESPPRSTDRYSAIDSGREPPRSRAPPQRGPTESVYYEEETYGDSGYRQASMRKCPEPEMSRNTDYYDSYASEDRPSRKRPLIDSYPDEGGDYRSSGPSSSRGPVLGSRPGPPKRERFDYSSSDRRRR